MSEQPEIKPTAVKAKNVPEKCWHCDFCLATAKAIQRRDRHKCANPDFSIPNSRKPTFTLCTGPGCERCAARIESTGCKFENKVCRVGHKMTLRGTK